MPKAIWVLVMVTVALIGPPVSSLGEQASELDQLRQKADAVLAQSNVSAGRDIGIVFELVDGVLEEDHSEEADKYIVQGLKHFPWNLKYQMIHAELLAREGKLDKANEKADLVLQYGEAEDLIERARKLLDKSPLPAFTQIRSLPGTDHRVVLGPLQECDKCKT